MPWVPTVSLVTSLVVLPAFTPPGISSQSPASPNEFRTAKRMKEQGTAVTADPFVDWALIQSLYAVF